jgi:hypothetical protein
MLRFILCNLGRRNATRFLSTSSFYPSSAGCHSWSPLDARHGRILFCYNPVRSLKGWSSTSGLRSLVRSTSCPGCGSLTLTVPVGTPRCSVEIRAATTWSAPPVAPSLWSWWAGPCSRASLLVGDRQVERDSLCSATLLCRATLHLHFQCPCR